ncbi:MAG: hypothetical protein J5864_08885 [Oscillospiraceae bacterium]|nr:hypothetical protein [Oscillospiraceae bacterium]
MFEYEIVSKSCVNMRRKASAEAKDNNIPVLLENGITAEGFVNEIGNLFGANDKLISVDVNDIATLLEGKKSATFGRIRFLKCGDEYTSDDDIAWFENMKASAACFFLEGDIKFRKAIKIAEALSEALEEDGAFLFSLKCDENSEKNAIMVSILAAKERMG